MHAARPSLQRRVLCPADRDCQGQGASHHFGGTSPRPTYGAGLRLSSVPGLTTALYTNRYILKAIGIPGALLGVEFVKQTQQWRDPMGN